MNSTLVCLNVICLRTSKRLIVLDEELCTQFPYSISNTLHAFLLGFYIFQELIVSFMNPMA